MKPSGIAKTVDMVVVVTSALFVSLKESHIWRAQTVEFGVTHGWRDLCGQCCDSKCSGAAAD